MNRKRFGLVIAVFLAVILYFGVSCGAQEPAPEPESVSRAEFQDVEERVGDVEGRLTDVEDGLADLEDGLADLEDGQADISDTLEEIRGLVTAEAEDGDEGKEVIEDSQSTQPEQIEININVSQESQPQPQDQPQPQLSRDTYYEKVTFLVPEKGHYKFTIVPSDAEIFIDEETVVKNQGVVYLTSGWHEYYSHAPVKITVWRKY